MTLTEISLRTLKPPESGQKTYWDKTLTGFGVRVSQGGTKSFVLVYGPTRTRVTIGRYPVISLKEARTEAKHILAHNTLRHRRVTPITFEEAEKRFLEACRQKNKPRTVADYERLLRLHFRFSRTHLAAITQHDVMRRIHRLKDTPAEQNHAFVVARAFFRWAARHNYLERSPLEGLSLPAPVKYRDRVLADHELHAVYRRALEYPYPFGPIVALLILTGQRRGEIAALKWDWIKEDTITLPAALVKNRRTHTFPLGHKAAEVIEQLPRMGDHLFPAARSHVRGKPTTIFNGFAKAKADFDRNLKVDHYTLHDLRRTFSSGLASLGVPIHVTEKLLNHVSGTISGVTAIYNRHAYLGEMHQALGLWEDHLEWLARKA